MILPNLNAFYLKISFLPLPFLLRSYLTPCHERKASGLWPLVLVFAVIYLNAESSKAPEILIRSTGWMILPFTKTKGRRIRARVRMEMLSLQGPGANQEINTSRQMGVWDLALRRKS